MGTKRGTKTPRRYWLCRSRRLKSGYLLFWGRRPRRDGVGGSGWTNFDKDKPEGLATGEYFFCAEIFEFLFPDLALSPGEGPVPVTVEILRWATGKGTKRHPVKGKVVKRKRPARRV